MARIKKTLDTRRSRSSAGKVNERSLENLSRLPVRTGRRRGVASGLNQAYPEPPADFLGTRPEWAINWAHLMLGLKPGEDFVYISYIAGIQVDFEEFGLGIALNIQGLFWHYEFSGGKQIEDIFTRALIESTGAILINIDEDHALQDPIYYLKEALAGRDHSLQARGIA